jgi:origin recognition complex subunit 2
MENAEEVAETEDGRIMTRGSQRMRLARNLGGEDESSEEEEEESEEEEEGEEEEEEAEVEEDDDDDDETTKQQETLTEDFENFFQYSARKKKSLTSNNTLSQLPTLTPQESTALLAGIKDHHVDEIKKLHDAHCEQFAQWKFEINHGYNILLFGYGSKRSLIEAFGREELAEEMSVLVINGYFPNLSLDTILTQILEHIAPKVSTTGDKLRLIQTYLSEPLALLIHSLDSPVLRLPKNQQILSTLASNKYITIIASVDHVNAPLLFDSLKASRYNFLWHDATTFVPLHTELSFEDSTFLSGGTNATSSVGGLSGIKNVLNNLTTNARALYLLLLQHQLPLHPENNDPAEQEQGITFPLLRQLCAKKILPLANPTTLRGLLGEFFDHGLLVRNDGRGNVQGRKGKGGGEVLWAPFGKSVIENVIEFLGGQPGTA